jgi:hypothetical protein
MMFFVIVVLAAIGLASLLGATVSSAFAAAGALLLIPLLLFKLFLIMAFFGLAGRAWQRKSGPSWRRDHRPLWERDRDPAPGPSPEEKFEELHRMAHAKQEVDSWVPEG